MKTTSFNNRRTARVFACLLLAGVVCLAGCLSKPALRRQTFSFNVPMATGTNGVSGPHVLKIRALQIAAPFEEHSLVYRTGEFTYVRDPYAGFLESPANDLLAPIREGLRQAGFAAVAESGSAVTADTLVEINVNQLFGDFRQPEHPAAVLTIRFVFLDAPHGIPGKVIFQQEYSRRIALDAPTAAALMAGWDQALGEILKAVSADFLTTNGHRFNAKARRSEDAKKSDPAALRLRVMATLRLNPDVPQLTKKSLAESFGSRKCGLLWREPAAPCHCEPVLAPETGPFSGLRG